MENIDVSLKGVNVSVPYSLEAEQAILGAALIDPETVSAIVEQVKPEYFYVGKNKRIFSEIRMLFLSNTATDVITVNNAVLRAKIFDDENESKVYLSQLADTVPSLSNLGEYIRIIKDKYTLRSIMGIARDMLNDAQNGDDSRLVLEKAEQTIYTLSQGKDVRALEHISKSASDGFDRLRKLAGPDRDKYRGIPTGYRFLDAKLGKMGKSDLIVLAARPGMGKTSFALNIAQNVATNKTAVAVFSLEMSKEQLNDRLLSAQSGITSRHLRTGDIEVDEWDKIADAIDHLSRLPIYLDDTPSITVSDMKSKIRRLNSEPDKDNIGLVVVDYIQLMSTGRRTENRVQEISEITRNLKIMAKELDVPIIALSQLSRSAEKQKSGDNRPQLSDLRDSGSIEQDADVVLFLYRDAYYNKGEDVDRTRAKCIIAKNRHGEVADIPLSWDGAHTRFYDVDFTHADER